MIRRKNSTLEKNIEDLNSAIQNFNLEQGDEKTIEDCLDGIDFIDTSTFEKLKTKASYQLDFYSNAIEKLAEAADIEAGVQWSIDQKNNTLVRDARHATGLRQNSVYSQLATAFNSARAADRMIRIKDGEIRTDKALSEDEQTRVAEIKAKLQQITDTIKATPQDINLKALNGFLVDVLKQDERYNTINNATLLKRLNTTKDLAGLEDKKYNICTIYKQTDSNGGTRTVFEAEAIIPPLPDDYEKIKSTVISAQAGFSGNMVSAYWSALEAQETIPTQNLKTLPGLRNAYLKQVGEITADGIEIFAQSMHTGTVSSGVKTGDNLIANMNVAHMSSQGNEELIITSLNSPGRLGVLFDGGIEHQTFKQLDEAVQLQNGFSVSRALTPMNSFRRFVPTKVKAYDNALQKLGNQLTDVNPAIGKYLSGKWFASERRARKELKKVSNPEIKQILELAIKTKSAVAESAFGSFWRWLKSFVVTLEDHGMSRSQRQTAGMVSLTGLVNSGALGQNIRMPEISIHCKSGKDRTGAISIDSTRRIIGTRIGTNSMTDNLEKQVKAGHVGKMAEFGGTPGSVGMKGHAGLSGMIYNQVLMSLIALQTASNNKIAKRADVNIMPDVNQTIPQIMVSEKPSKPLSDIEIPQKLGGASSITKKHAKALRKKSLEEVLHR